jgi:polyisoprenoid-binding protein YceI
VDLPQDRSGGEGAVLAGKLTTGGIIMSPSTIRATRPVRTNCWEIDPVHSHVEFTLKQLMIATVKGRFTDVRGTVSLDDLDPAMVAVNLIVGVASIDTRVKRRDAHLCSPDFFDAKRFPAITFRSRRVLGNSLKGAFRLIGDLTIRGVTSEVVLDVMGDRRVKDAKGSEHAGFHARTSIERNAFGLTWNRVLETGGLLVGNEVRIALAARLVKRQATPPARQVGSAA